MGLKYKSCEKSQGQTMLLLATIIIIDFFTIFVATESTAVVYTTTGPVQGEILTTYNSVKYAAFKGIRFGKAPVERLRFKPPVPADPWTKTLNATTEGPPCIQNGAFGLIGSEDCLFINVLTPVTKLQSRPKKLKSVMAFIYGGGFVYGVSSPELYHPDYILGKDVVYVSFNYRLGALGFLSLNHPEATGNAGLKDQVLALKWIQANIAQFGGNPNNVTIFGQSAGAACVGYHVLSDASAGLFHGAISMSGAPLNFWAFQTIPEIQSVGERLGVKLGAASTDKETLLETFYRSTAIEILNATNEIIYANISFTPTLEDRTIAKEPFLSECSVKKYKTGNYNKVPQIMGFMDQETLANFISAESFVETVLYLIGVLANIGMKLPPGLTEAKRLIDSGEDFFNKLPSETLYRVINETTDILYVSQIDQTEKLLAVNNRKPVYYYHVSFNNNKSINNILEHNPILGPGHADDLAYIFYFAALNWSTDLTDPTARTVYRYSTMWTNFAKYGNPTPHWVKDDNLKITWPNSGRSGISLDIGTELVVGPRPISENARRIQSFSEPLLETMGGCKAKC